MKPRTLVFSVVTLALSFQGVFMNWLAKLFIILGSIVSLLIAMNVGKWL